MGAQRGIGREGQQEQVFCLYRIRIQNPEFK
jgi:hypothetical protein